MSGYNYKIIVTTLEPGEEDHLNDLLEGGKIVNVEKIGPLPSTALKNVWDQWGDESPKSQKSSFDKSYYKLLVEKRDE